jgi:hypothetical protein
MKAPHCQECGERLPTPGQGTPRLFCDDVCRQRHKRKERAAELKRLRKLAAKR